MSFYLFYIRPNTPNATNYYRFVEGHRGILAWARNSEFALELLRARTAGRKRCQSTSGHGGEKRRKKGRSSRIDWAREPRLKPTLVPWRDKSRQGPGPPECERLSKASSSTLLSHPTLHHHIFPPARPPRKPTSPILSSYYPRYPHILITGP
jgi:hypothetical protein